MSEGFEKEDKKKNIDETRGRFIHKKREKISECD